MSLSNTSIIVLENNINVLKFDCIKNMFKRFCDIRNKSKALKTYRWGGLSIHTISSLYSSISHPRDPNPAATFYVTRFKNPCRLHLRDTFYNMASLT